MANTKQAKKRAAQNDKQKARNRAVKSETRRVVKATRAAAPESPRDDMMSWLDSVYATEPTE